MCDTIYDMATRLNQQAERRTPLPLTARDLADLDRLRESGPERQALANMADSLPAGEVSESLLVHAVFVAGLRAVREAAEELGYAELAVQEAVSGESADRRRAAERTHSWADED
jgi:hypothetical protein